MAKTHNNLYQQLLSYDFIERAFYDSIKGKAHRKPVSDFRNNLPIELLQLLHELKSGTYEPRPYNEFFVYEPKRRLIKAPQFRDVVVQRAIYNIIMPIFDRTFIEDSYGCRIDKGTHKASDCVQEMMRASDPESYYLQMDISKYFYSIDRTVLIELLKKKISDARLLDLIIKFIPDETGIPIGNILSQLFSNIYLNKIDQLCKRALSVKNYVRYVDDFIIIGQSKEQIHSHLKRIESELSGMKLKLSRFTIQKIKRGINFCGYRTWRRAKFLRKRTIKHFNSALNNCNTRSMMSYLGHAKPSANYRSQLHKVESKLCQQSISTNQLSRKVHSDQSKTLRTLKKMKFRLSVK